MTAIAILFAVGRFSPPLAISIAGATAAAISIVVTHGRFDPATRSRYGETQFAAATAAVCVTTATITILAVAFVICAWLLQEGPPVSFESTVAGVFVAALIGVLAGLAQGVFTGVAYLAFAFLTLGPYYGDANEQSINRKKA